jgi:hypothetical protein
MMELSTRGGVTREEVKTWEQWCERVRRFDFSYAYSDDGSVYRAGRQEEEILKRAAKQFPIEDVKQFWNEQADRKFIKPANKQFYWRD